MKIHLFLVADPYNTRGWSIYAVEEHDKWALEHNQEREDSLLLHVQELNEPLPEMLVKIGMAKVEEMEEDLAKEIAIKTQRVKEFESKFLSLAPPSEMEKEELS